MKLAYLNGITSVITRVRILDYTSTTGGAKTGLTSASSGLIISTIADNEATPTAYTVAGSTIETITTLGTFAAPTATKCRFKEVDATNHPGLYEVQIADARWAVTNARSVIITVSGATGMVQTDAEIQLEPVPADTRKIGGTSQTARDIGLSVLLDQTQAIATNPTANSVGEALFLCDILGGRFGTAQAGAASTITLDSGASSVDNRYVSYMVYLYGGTGGGVRGTGQARTITAYNGSTKVATLDSAWGTNPDNTSKFMLVVHPPANALMVNGTLQTARDIGANVDATVSSRLASSSYTAPDNTNIVIAAAAAASAATSASTLLARIGAFTGTGVNTVLGFFKSLLSKTATMPSDIGGTFDPTTDSTEAIRDRGDAAWITGATAGSGANVVTLTVNDGTTALQNATVRLTLNSTTLSVTTNASGIATFACDNGTWTVAISLAGYQFTPTTLAISGTTSHTYSMIAVTITPSDVGYVTGYGTALGDDRLPAVGVTFSAELISSTVVGVSPVKTPISAVSTTGGLVQFTNLLPGTKWRFWRGATTSHAVTKVEQVIPAIDFELPANILA